MSSIAIFVLLLILLLVALGLGVYFGLKRNVVQTSVRAGMIVFSIILSAILAATLTPTMFKGMISLFNSFFGSETLAYLAGDSDGANGILSFVYALAAPFTFFVFFFIITLALVGVYNFLCRFFITDEKLAEWAERKKAKEGDKAEELPEDGTAEAEAAPEEEEPAVRILSADEAMDNESVSVIEPDDGDFDPEADEENAEPAASEEAAAEEEAEGETADESDEEAEGAEEEAAAAETEETPVDGAENPEENPEEGENPDEEEKPEDEAVAAKEEDKEEDKKEKKGLSPKIKRAILVAANAVCSVILAVAMVVPVTSVISACAGLIEAAGGEKSAQDYVDEINTNEDTTEAKDFITQISDIDSNFIYNVYRVLGVPVVYSITGVKVGDSQSQPLSKALTSSEDLICSVLELMANADLLSRKVTWPEYAAIMYEASESVAEAPYWDKLLGSFFSDASLKWVEGDSFIGIAPPFSESMENYDDVLEEDIYKILSENNLASLEFRAVADALTLMSSVACVNDSDFDSVSTFYTLMENVTAESAAIVKEYITDDLMLSLDYSEEEIPFFKQVYTSVLDGALAVGTGEYADEGTRKAVFTAEAESVVAFLKFTEDPSSVTDKEFADAYSDSDIVKGIVADVTSLGKVNDPAGIASAISDSRYDVLKDMFIEKMGKDETITYNQYLYVLAYITK